MEIPILIVSDPPHQEVNLEAAGGLLGLDVFATRLKAGFAAPEVLWASGPQKAAEFVVAMRGTGFTVAAVRGAALTGLPWPDPVTSLAFDESCLRATQRGGGVEIGYDTETVGIYCRPPADFSPPPTVDLGQAIASGHGPTIAEAVQWMSSLDLYFSDEGSLRRVSIVPELFELDGADVVKEVDRRFKCLRLDTRLAGVRPRARFVSGEEGEVRSGTNRRTRYSFGTAPLRDLLESISPELRDIPQYEFGSRLGYALGPLRTPTGSS